jgi:hypothetical protein
MALTVTLVQNSAIPRPATANRTSTVGEPSLSNAGNNVFFTGNWYAAQSTNHGAAWSHVDPFSIFPPVDDGFCCDQTTIFAPSHNITIWLLQYQKKNGTNTLRLAVRSTGGAWHFWDFRPTTVNPAWTDLWFDYNSAALSNNFLYVTSNVFDFSQPKNKWKRAVVLRFRLADLAAGAGLPFNTFTTTSNGSLRCTLGARDVMYFGSQNSLSEIRLFTWPESSTSVTQRSIAVAPWSDGGYTAVCPDGHEWLTRTDGRITAAWLAGGEIGFAWSAAARSQRPFPYVRVVRINEATKAVVGQPDIWNPNTAWVYPDACPNDNGVVGITLFRGGGPNFPSHVVGVLDGATWKLALTRNGTNAPSDTKWGDYLTCRRHSPDGTSWIAAGYTLQGGSDRTNIEPRFVHFRV